MIIDVGEGVLWGYELGVEVGVTVGLDSGTLAPALGVVGFREELGGRLHVGGAGRFGDWECRQTEAEGGWF